MLFPPFPLKEIKKTDGFTLYSALLKDGETNLYFLVNEKKECILVDPATESQRVLNTIKDNQFNVKGIFLTHNHWDHSLEVNQISSILKLQFMANDEQRKMGKTPYGTPLLNNRCFNVTNGETITCGSFEFTVIHTPGHSAGSMCLYHKKTKTLFTGDTVFKGTVGRTDLDSSDPDAIIPSIFNLFKQVPKDADIYPGHGEPTNVSFEIENNPFLVN